MSRYIALVLYENTAMDMVVRGSSLEELDKRLEGLYDCRIVVFDRKEGLTFRSTNNGWIVEW